MKKSIVLLFALAVVAGCASSQHSQFTKEAERDWKNTYNPYSKGVGGMRPAR